MKRNIKIGLIWFFGPFASLLIVLTLWAVVAFGSSAVFTSGGGSTIKMVMLLNAILGLLGLISVIATPIGVIIGIIYFIKKDPIPVAQDQGQNVAPVEQQPIEQVQSVAEEPVAPVNEDQATTTSNNNEHVA